MCVLPYVNRAKLTAETIENAIFNRTSTVRQTVRFFYDNRVVMHLKPLQLLGFNKK